MRALTATGISVIFSSFNGDMAVVAAVRRQRIRTTPRPRADDRVVYDAVVLLNLPYGLSAAMREGGKEEKKSEIYVYTFVVRTIRVRGTCAARTVMITRFFSCTHGRPRSGMLRFRFYRVFFFRPLQSTERIPKYHNISEKRI